MDNHTKLVQAVYRRDILAVRQNIAEMGRKGAQMKTALMHAAILDFSEAIEIMLKAPQAELELRHQDNEGNSALIMAVQRNSKRAVLLLAEREHGIINNEGQFALLLATLQNSVQLVDMLVEYESKIHFDDRTPLIIAIECGCTDVIPTLIMYEGRQLCKARSRSYSLIKYAAAVRPSFEGIEPGNEQDDQPRLSSSLMVAALEGNMLAVKYLVGHEGGMQDPRSGETALIRVLDKITQLSATGCDTNANMLNQLLSIAQILAQVPEEAQTCDLQGRYPADIISNGCSELLQIELAKEDSLRDLCRLVVEDEY